MTDAKKQRMRRKRPRTSQTFTFYLPDALVRAIERQAEINYGGNRSALVTDVLARELGMQVQEVMTKTA